MKIAKIQKNRHAGAESGFPWPGVPAARAAPEHPPKPCLAREETAAPVLSWPRTF